MLTQTDNFVSIAKEYCAWAEGAPLAPENEARKAIQLLVTLYANILALPNNGCGEDRTAQEITTEEWQVIYKRFGSLPFNYYCVSFSPANIEEKSSIGDLADDLADIYRDIKDGLRLYENGHTTEAIWEWKHGFNIHWGRHAASALHALQSYMADEYLEL